MANLNKVMLIGRLTRDPELRYTQQGAALTELGLAVNRTFGQGEARKDETTFVDVTAWQRQAEVICQYLKKGSPIFIEGRLKLDSWQAKDGGNRSKLGVVLENFQFLDSPRERSEGGGGGGAGGGRAFQGGAGPDYGAPTGVDYGASQGAPRSAPPPSENAPGPDGMGLGDADIPF